MLLLQISAAKFEFFAVESARAKHFSLSPISL